MSKNTKAKAEKVETEKVETKVWKTNTFTPKCDIYWNRKVWNVIVKTLIAWKSYDLEKELVEKTGIIKYSK